MSDPFWHTFRHPEVRALAWARFSAPLVAGMGGDLPAVEPSDVDFFRALDLEPAPLLLHLARCQSYRLGLYFEELWSYYLLHHPSYELISHNLQIKDPQRRTLGAFDFIYRHLPTGSVHHLEVAVKFYLYYGENTQQIDDQKWWPGPNPRDTLHHKVERLLTHQLPLSASPEGITAITGLNCPAVSQTSAALKGYLFYPWNQSWKTPNWAEPHHCRGQWLPIDTLPHLIDQHRQDRWMLLVKRDWLGEVRALPKEATYMGEEMVITLNKQASKYPLMLARLEETTRGYDEVERFFVTPDAWPGENWK